MDQIDRVGRFYYSEDEKRNILNAIGLSDGKIADRLIYECETVTHRFIASSRNYAELPTDKQMILRLHRINWHLEQVLLLAKFQNEDKSSDAYLKFWSVVLITKRLTLPEWRMKKFRKLYNGIAIASRYLDSIIYNEESSSLIAGNEYSVDDDKQLCGAKHLKTLSCVFFNVLNKKPGRSKSTIGPFVRFAYAAMLPASPRLTPSIETLNERWARLKFDPREKSLIQIELKEILRFRGREASV
jgi:hypothetical protein